MLKKKLSVILPVYNEEKTIITILRRIEETKDDRIEYEIIVINDGSKDNTLELLKSNNNLYQHLIDGKQNFGIKDFKTYEKFSKEIYKIKENVIKNISRIKENNNIVGYGSPAKATTALNFFGISSEIDFIVEDNKLKHGKFLPGVNIPIVGKDKISQKVDCILVLAWNFFEDIKKNNKNLCKKFLNVKDLEKNQINKIFC